MKACSKPDCDCPVASRGLCHKHYNAARKAGTLPKRMASRRYTQDENGQWWYVRPSGRSRCVVVKCMSCGADVPRALRDAERIKNSFCPNCPRTGQNHNAWRGGRQVAPGGYIYEWSPSHPRAIKSGYVLEHVLVLEEYLGRYLLPHETVHHKNGVRNDNRLDNLELWSKSHPAGQRVQDKVEWAKEILKLYAPHELATA